MSDLRERVLDEIDKDHSDIFAWRAVRALRAIIEGHVIYLTASGDYWRCRGCDWPGTLWNGDPAPVCPNMLREVERAARELGIG